MRRTLHETDRYAALFGPATGDRVRLADTDLVAEISAGVTLELAGGGGISTRQGSGSTPDGPTV